MKGSSFHILKISPLIFLTWTFFFSDFIKVLSGGDVTSSKQRFHPKSNDQAGPVFDPTTATNITVQLGTHAYLPCKVSPPYIKTLGNKSVSWIRRHDAHILTVDRYTFIADERFQAFFVEGTDTWTLQVKYVQPRDTGLYECQISSEPKLSHFIQLNVVVPKTEIVGEAEMYVKAGSTVSLRCVISRSLEEPAYIFWYRDSERVLNYDRSLIDIRMERIGADTTQIFFFIEKPHKSPNCSLLEPVRLWHPQLEYVVRLKIGQLTIYNTRRKDSGNYSCNPSNLDSASMILHVLNGEQPAAMQHGNAGWRVSRREGIIPLLSLVSLALLAVASRQHV